MKKVRVIAVATAGMTGAGGVVSAVLGSPAVAIGLGSLTGLFVLSVLVVMLRAALTVDETRHAHALAVLDRLVFAACGAVPPYRGE